MFELHCTKDTPQGTMSFYAGYASHNRQNVDDKAHNLRKMNPDLYYYTVYVPSADEWNSY